MFELRACGQYTDEEIAQKINDMGYRGYAKRSLGLKKTQKVNESQKTEMTAKQMWRMVRHPIYAGINREKWTDNKPIKCAFEGLVSIELFNHANKDRRVIIEHGNNRFTIEDIKEKRHTDKGKRDNLFPYKKFVLCPECRSPLHASSSRGKSGKLYPAYHCRRQKHNFRIGKAELESKVDEFIGKLQLSPAYAEQYMIVVKKSWQHLHSQHEDRIKRFDKRVAGLRAELDATVQKIKVLNNQTAIKCMEDELVRLEKEISHVEQQKQALTTKKPMDLKEIGRRLKHIFEHFDQAAKNQMNPVKKARLFSLLFDRPPTYDDLDFRTPGSATFTGVNPLFMLKNSLFITSGASGGIRTPDTRFRRPVL